MLPGHIQFHSLHKIMKCVHKYIVKNIGTIFYTLNYEVKRALPLEVIELMKDDLSGK